MTKSILLQLTMILALALTTSCSKDEIATQPSEENTTPISIKLDLAKLETDSRASYQEPELKDVRVTMIVALDGKMLYNEKKEYETISTESNISFSTNLVTGKEYTIALWADFKDGDSYHYKLVFNDETLPPYVSMTTTRTGSNNKYDAYWGMTEAIIEKNQTIEVTLKRPLAIVNINATDWSTVTSNQPTTYSTTVNAYTRMNLLTGEVNDTKENITINGNIADANTGNLSYDYFFAKDQTENLESFTVKYSSSNNNNISYSYTFSNIPIKRNTMTNVSGKIFNGNQTNQ